MSTQIRQLEDYLGEQLFIRAGRKLMLTASGRLVLGYAEEIFALGEEMQRALPRVDGTGPRRLHVGLVNSVPKLVAREFLRPVSEFDPPVTLICHEGVLEELAARLSLERLDMILADEPLTGEAFGAGLNHRLGGSGVLLCATNRLWAKFRRGFPQSLNDAPILLPTPVLPLRRALGGWFARLGLEPNIVGEFDDTALLKDFAADGLGIAPVHEIAAAQAQKLYGLKPLGKAEGVSADFFVIAPKRALRNPAIRSIASRALPA